MKVGEGLSELWAAQTLEQVDVKRKCWGSVGDERLARRVISGAADAYPWESRES
jgi:hypothetical protein